MYADVVSDRRIYYICRVHPCKVRESDANQINIDCYGLQQRFIDWSLEVANASGVKYIHATVNPYTNHSGQNFLKRGLP
jgi:hypothetical protein